MVANRWRRVAAGLLLFGISFGYLEAAVVVYLRTVYDPIRIQIRPERPPEDLFPLITFEQLQRAAPDRLWLLGVEVGREAATILMLAAIAIVVTGEWQMWLPAFAVAFGTWDLFFYVFLKVLLRWPASLFTWDILFLIPVPWAAPVLAPVIVSLSIIACGLVALRRRVRMKAIYWAGITFGCLLILASFMWDSRNLMAGGLPQPFAWPLFAVGEAIGVTTFYLAFKKSHV
jgi:hypothetical protein